MVFLLVGRVDERDVDAPDVIKGGGGKSSPSTERWEAAVRAAVLEEGGGLGDVAIRRALVSVDERCTWGTRELAPDAVVVVEDWRSCTPVELLRYAILERSRSSIGSSYCSTLAGGEGGGGPMAAFVRPPVSVATINVCSTIKEEFATEREGPASFSLEMVTICMGSCVYAMGSGSATTSTMTWFTVEALDDNEECETGVAVDLNEVVAEKAVNETGLWRPAVFDGGDDDGRKLLLVVTVLAIVVCKQLQISGCVPHLVQHLRLVGPILVCGNRLGAHIGFALERR